MKIPFIKYNDVDSAYPIRVSRVNPTQDILHLQLIKEIESIISGDEISRNRCAWTHEDTASKILSLFLHKYPNGVPNTEDYSEAQPS